MRPFKIGVLSDSFRLAPREGLRKSKEVGASGVQVYACQGEVSPEGMDAAARKDFKAFVAGLGLEIAALCGDLGGGFADEEKNPPKVKKSKEIVDLAVDLGTRVVTTHIGVVPEDRNANAYKTMLAACKELADHAAKKGVTFAVETGPEKAVTLKGFIDAVGSKGIGVNLDPANLVMVVADDPAQAVHTLGKYIVHTHAKDGVQLKPGDAEAIYGGAPGIDYNQLFKEVPLGQGGVNWDEYLDALEAVGFKGYLTIEREVGEDPAKDIREAVKFLRKKIGA